MPPSLLAPALAPPAPALLLLPAVAVPALPLFFPALALPALPFLPAAPLLPAVPLGTRSSLSSHAKVVAAASTKIEAKCSVFTRAPCQS
jgi:hypothetical protein